MFRKQWKVSPYSVVTVIGFLLLWQAIVSLRLVNPFFLPSPLSVMKTLMETIGSVELLLHGSVTLGRIFHGFFWGALAGLGLGIPAGWSKRMYEAINPKWSDLITKNNRLGEWKTSQNRLSLSIVSIGNFRK